MTDSTTVRVRVSTQRLHRAERILDKLGLDPSEAFNMMLAQIELRKGLPFDVRIVEPSVSSDEQARAWTEAMGAY